MSSSLHKGLAYPIDLKNTLLLTSYKLDTVMLALAKASYRSGHVRLVQRLLDSGLCSSQRDTHTEVYCGW